jgi:hypothetical protein
MVRAEQRLERSSKGNAKCPSSNNGGFSFFSGVIEVKKRGGERWWFLSRYGLQERRR